MERLEPKIVSEKFVKYKGLHTPIDQAGPLHWFETEYKITTYNDGTSHSIEVVRPKDLGPATRAEMKEWRKKHKIKSPI